MGKSMFESVLKKRLCKLIAAGITCGLVLCLLFIPGLVNADTPIADTDIFKIETVFEPSRLVANQMITAKVVAANISSEPYEGTKNVLVIAGLYDGNNTMINVSYISKGIAYMDIQTLTAGFKLPADIRGCAARAFVWDGTDIRTSNMLPLSNVVQVTDSTVAPSPTIVKLTPTETPLATPTITPAPTLSFAKGADISWLPQMETNGYKFYNDSGVQQDCLQILKDHGVNSVRIRTWVNPSSDKWNGHCSTIETIALAKRAKSMGFRIMIDFHYSDSWADPGQQTKPASWNNLDFNALMKKTYDYTYDVMTQLKNNGIYPEWVQVGNETNDGMLWEDGRASKNMKNFAWFINCGHDAVKAVSSKSKVIVHISNGYSNSLFRWMFDGLESNGAKYDVIGMSLYPEIDNYSTLASQCLTNMKDMVSRYGKEVMICEAGMPYDYPSQCKEFISDMLKMTRSVPDEKGLGVFYWEPEAYPGINGYNKGAWNSKGNPTIALDAFLN